MKLQQIKSNKQFFVCLPGAIVRAKGWQKGDIIAVEIDGKGNLVLKRKE